MGRVEDSLIYIEQAFLFVSPPVSPALSRSLFCTVLLAGIFYVVPLCRDNPLRRCSTLFQTGCKAPLTATPHQCSEPWREREGGGGCDRCRGVKRNAKDEVHSCFISNPAHFSDIFTWSYGMGGVWTRYGFAPLCVVHVSSASAGGAENSRTAGVGSTVSCMHADFSCAYNKTQGNTCACSLMCASLI